MGKIKLLSESMIGKIAAGEVVERPAAAVKELVENSMDAGASAVTVEIRDGGLSYIRVTDNGSGIDESDIRMAFERHATSKLSAEQDLYAISTLGFRGEALASIAAVSRVTLTTRTASRDTGLKVTNEGGKITDIAETACPVGTTIVVHDLFYNTPVRRGFMKKASAEGAAVSDLIMQLVLSRPDISFRYISAGKTVCHSPGDGQLSSAVHTVFGSQTLKTMRPVSGHMNGVLLSGFVGIGENARGNRGHEMFFINRRMMHSPLLSSALEAACRERVMIGKFPVCALHLQIPYEAVDVNVHPNKLEVRFRDEAAVAEAVTTLVLESLQDRDAFEKPVEMRLEKSEQRKPPEYSQSLTEDRPPVSPGKPPIEVTVTSVLPPEAGIQFAEKPSPRSMPTAPVIPSPPPVILSEVKNPEQVNTILPRIKKDMKVFGALFRTYILIEYEDQLLMIDQHAVHERLLFDRLMADHADGHIAGQELLVPVIISLTEREAMLIDQHKDLLESIGLTIDSFGQREGAVRSVPIILGETEPVSFVRDMLADLEAGRGLTNENQRTALLQTACKHAVKGGESLTEDQLRSLAEEMIEKKVTPTCPHGRPLVVAITHRELDRKFKRIQ